MAIKRNISSNIEKITEERQMAIEKLGELGITTKDMLRFQKFKGSEYIKFYPSYINKDGSIAAYAEGQWRAFASENLEKREIGPRGGETWIPLIAM